jgi:hypothetical protein
MFSTDHHHTLLFAGGSSGMQWRIAEGVRLKSKDDSNGEEAMHGDLR